MTNLDELKLRLTEKLELDAEISRLANLVYQEIPVDLRGNEGAPESAEIDEWNSCKNLFLTHCGGDEYSSICVPLEITDIADYFREKKRLEEEKRLKEAEENKIAEEKRLRLIYENLKKRFENVDKSTN